MSTRIKYYWQLLNESLWFTPGVMVLAAVGLAYGLIEFDASTAWNGAKQYPLLFGVGAEGSRGMLTAIAGSMLTVATLAFSLTLSSIAQVSSQYSPRVLRNFMNDRVNQVVMGYFVAVFTYCLIVLGTIRGTDEQKFVPATAVLVGLALALGGVVALIFFIHHIAESIQTGTIVQHIARETKNAIGGLFPEQLGETVDDTKETEAILRYADEETGWYPVCSSEMGYLLGFDPNGLLRWASRYRVVVRMEKEVGTFVGEDSIIFSVRSGMERPAPKQADWPDELMKYVRIGRHRNIEQDVGFGIQQLVDIALKALSPGINDTTTAIMAVDYLGGIGELLAKRPFPDLLRSDGQHVRVLVKAPDFNAYVRLTFDLIRINSEGNHAVIRRLMRALALIGANTLTDDRKPIVREQAELLLAFADQTLVTAYEKQQVRELYDSLKPDWR